jgi:hypothetical protein
VLVLGTVLLVGALRTFLGTITMISLGCLALYALVYNPKFGQGDSRTLVLTIAGVFAVVATVVLSIAFFSD